MDLLSMILRLHVLACYDGRPNSFEGVLKRVFAASGVFALQEFHGRRRPRRDDLARFEIVLTDHLR